MRSRPVARRPPVKGPTAIRIRGALKREGLSREREGEGERETGGGGPAGWRALLSRRVKRRRRESERVKPRRRVLPARQPRELFLKIAFFLPSPAAIMAHLKWQSCGRQCRRAIAASCATFGDPTLGPGPWTVAVCTMENLSCSLSANPYRRRTLAILSRSMAEEYLEEMIYSMWN